MALRCFDVAVWKHWPCYGFPLVADGVQAQSAFAAVEQVMRAHGLRWADQVAARAADGSIKYWGYRVLLVQARREAREQADLWSSVDQGMEPGACPGPVTLHELLFAWGQAHGFPEVYWPLPECPDVRGVIPAGEQAWRETREKGLPEYVRAAYWAAMRVTRV